MTKKQIILMIVILAIIIAVISVSLTISHKNKENVSNKTENQSETISSSVNDLIIVDKKDQNGNVVKINGKTQQKDIENGIIFLSYDTCGNCELLKSRINEVGNKNNAEIKMYNLSNKEDENIVNQYLEKHKTDIENYNKVTQYTQDVHNYYYKIEALRTATKEFVDFHKQYGDNINSQPNDIKTKYFKLRNVQEEIFSKYDKQVDSTIEESKALLLADQQKNQNLSDEDKNIILDKLKQISDIQQLNVDQLFEYISLLTTTQNKILINGKPDANNFKLIILYNGQIKRVVENKDIQSILDSQEKIDNYLVNDLHIKNYQNTNQMELVEKSIKDNKNQLVFIYTPICSSCQKVTPIIEEIEKNQNINIQKIDISLYSSATQLSNFLKNHNVNVKGEIPYLISFKDEKVNEILNGDKWKVQNINAESGYDVNQDVIKQFIEKNK